MKPLVSFCCPAYNKEEYLSYMVTMFLEQTYKNTELIIVDDASTDGTGDVCKYYAKKHKNIKYYRNKKNLGVADTRNIARSHAKGDIILVQDADDMPVNGRAELTVDYFKKHKDIDIMYGSFIYIDDRGTQRNSKIAEPFVISRMKLQNLVCHTTVAYRKSMPILYRKGLRYIDDWYFMLDVYNAGYKFGYTQELLGAYRVTKEGMSYDMGKETGGKKKAKESLKKEFENMEDNISENLKKSPEQRIRFRKILKRIPEGGTILDVGCNGGYTLTLYERKGHVDGVEIADNLREICEKKGFKIYDSIDDVKSKYDIVILGDILEHYNAKEAKELFIKSYNLAKKKLIITVPYPDGRFGKKFVPEHKADYLLGDIQSWLPNSNMWAIPIYYGDDAIPLWALIEVFK